MRISDVVFRLLQIVNEFTSNNTLKKKKLKTLGSHNILYYRSRNFSQNLSESYNNLQKQDHIIVGNIFLLITCIVV